MASEDQYRQLVARLEVQARAAPATYRRKVLALALLGYGALLSLLLVSLVVPLAIVVIALRSQSAPDPMLAFPVIAMTAFGVMLLRGVWVRFGAPPGYRLAADEAPALWDAVERLRHAVGAPALAGIVIDGDLNAAAATVPRLAGLLGHRHYLVLGMPLMRLLDRDELSAVIAHEFGHFGDRHGRLTGWIYRVRLSWLRSLHALSAGGSSITRLLVPLAGRYVRYFSAYSFVLARGNEYAADAAAVRAVGAAPAASALLRLEVASRRLQYRAQPELMRRARLQRQPPASVQSGIAAALIDPAAVDVIRLMVMATRDTDPDDTHPTLVQRLAAMDVAATWSPRVGTAASEWLGALEDTIAVALDADWRRDAAVDWAAQHAAAASDRERLDALERVADPSAQELVERGQLVESFHGPAAAATWYARALGVDPGSAVAMARLGLADLHDGKSANDAVLRLTDAVAIDDAVLPLVMRGLELLLADPAAPAVVVALHERMMADHGARIASFSSREGTQASDDLRAHGLDAAALGALADTLLRHPRIARAWLGRKGVAGDGEPPHYVLLLDWRGSVAGETAGLDAVARALSLDGSHTVFTGTGHADLAKRVRQLCSEPVYRKTRG